jgi:hypothetical protein
MTDYIGRLLEKTAIFPGGVPTETTKTVSVVSVGTQEGEIPDFQARSDPLGEALTETTETVSVVSVSDPRGESVDFQAPPDPERIRIQAKRRAVVTQGDSLRARGRAVGLCWLPEPQPRAVLGPMPGNRDDGKLWFE